MVLSQDVDIWGPHYWFFIHSISFYYPAFPNAVTKRKYYDFIQNLPLFIPDAEMGNKFSAILDRFPVSPYLDNRDSFMRWTHFIHNKYNEMLGKEELSLKAGIDRYLSEYTPKPVYVSHHLKMRSYVIHGVIFTGCLIAIAALYNNKNNIE
jgi:Erv1 / Alr family